jgi:hypothetical protein
MKRFLSFLKRDPVVLSKDKDVGTGAHTGL